MTEPLQQSILLEPRCLATTIGSMPHTDVRHATDLMFRSTPEIPSWVQFPKRSGRENMMIQFTEGMPGLVLQEGKVRMSLASDKATEELTEFYRKYLAITEAGEMEELEGFGLSADVAAGFHEMLAQLPDRIASGAVKMIKGQVTGPFTLGTNLLDTDDRCVYYDEQTHDVVVKLVAMKAMWQTVRLRAFGLPVIIFLDEPSLLGFGKQTYITISKENVVSDIDAVVSVIHALGGLAGVHCEENTDWSLLMETRLDILDFDAYDHFQAMTLYPKELAAFFERGGWLGWGIVPTLDRQAAATETLESLLERFDAGLSALHATGFDRNLLLRRALITPSCGMGGVLTEPLAERVLCLLRELSGILRQRMN
jgi:hypothetical protein